MAWCLVKAQGQLLL